MTAIAKNKKATIDATNGNLWKKAILFALPIMATDILNLLYNSADAIVVGQCAGHTALAAVTSTASTINLFNTICYGLGTGSGMLISQAYGAKNKKLLDNVLHTAVLTALMCGALILTIGLIFSAPILHLLNTPDNVMAEASLYLRIYMCGAPFNVMYIFCAKSLLGVGDSRHPLMYSSLSGGVNVLLNLLFDYVFGMGVAGVAIATVSAQALSCTLILIRLFRGNDVLKIEFKKLKFKVSIFTKTLAYGIPQAASSAMFSISNMVIQSAVNIFGDTVIAAVGAGTNIENISYFAMESFATANLTFVSQNTGARDIERIKKSMWVTTSLSVIAALLVGGLVSLCSRPLLLLFSGETEETFLNAFLEAGKIKIFFTSLPMFLNGTMDCFMQSMRGMGHPYLPTFIGVTLLFGMRLSWIFFLFPLYADLTFLIMIYPISWLATSLVLLVFLIITYNKTKRRWQNETPSRETPLA